MADLPSVQITHNGETLIVNEGESVLDCLLRHGHIVPYSCKTGACQSCLIKAIDGTPGEQAMLGLKSTLKKQNFFLACQCLPKENLTVCEPLLEESSFECKVVDKVKLNHDVIALRVELCADFPCRSGQFVNIVHPDGKTIRSYSIANLPDKDQYIEFNIRRIAGGKMTNWLHDVVNKGDSLRIRGASGDCFYCHHEEEERHFSIVLAGTGTGLAPLIGILLDALNQEHKGKIILLHGVRSESDLYYREMLEKLTVDFGCFDYIPCVLASGNSEEAFLPSRHIADSMLDAIKDLEPSKILAYFCGNPEMVALLKESFLQALGLSISFPILFSYC
ncbi:MAG: 2Fe-2S iron-sulfur cluster binding domain-containing protein [Bdellovibrionota bacterium]